jgi:hypothetical protein
MTDKVYKFYADAGHGWLAVKEQELYDLGIYDQISLYSYSKGQTVYTEEDMDMYLFVKAYEAKYGKKPEIKYVNHGDVSPIRSYQRFPSQVRNYKGM